MNPDIKPEKIAVITRNYYYTPYIYSESQAEVTPLVQYCDDEGYDTILFSPWTVHLNFYKQFDYSKLFLNTKNIRNIMFEFGNIYGDDDYSHFKDNITVLATRDNGVFHFKQQLAFSNPNKELQQCFFNDLEKRIFGDTLILLCGEINMSGNILENTDTDDTFGFRKYLDSSSIKLILNPIHTYMGSGPTLKKRLALADKEKVLLSYWNQYEDYEATVMHFSNRGILIMPYDELVVDNIETSYMITSYSPKL